jgi:lysozyme
MSMIQSFRDDLKSVLPLIMKHEGLRLHPYVDTTGNLTIGYGHNLTVNGLSSNICSQILLEDVDYFVKELTKAIPFFNELSVGRQAVLIDMCFNIGLKGLLGFKQMLEAIGDKDFNAAADCMLKSKWASQVGSRATEDAAIMKSGVL